MSEDRPCRCAKSLFKAHSASKCPLHIARTKALASVTNLGQSIGNTASAAVFQRNNSSNVSTTVNEDNLDGESVTVFEDETEISEISNAEREEENERDAIQRKVDEFLSSEESGGLEYSELGDNDESLDNDEAQPGQTKKRRSRPVAQLGRNISNFFSNVPGIIAAPVNTVSNSVSSSVTSGVKTVTTTMKKMVNTTQTTEKEDPSTPSNPIFERSKLDENINMFLLTALVSGLTAWIITAVARVLYLLVSFVRLSSLDFQLAYARTYILLTGTQTTFVIILLLISFHRVLGVVVSLLLRRHLQPADNNHTHRGIYDIHIGWIAFRGGFDHHEIVLHDICWRNPQTFHKSPFLLHALEVSVSFDLVNLLQFIFNNAILKIRAVTIDGLEVYFEKSDDPVVHRDYPLNLWAALGICSERRKSTKLDKLFMRMLRVIRNKLLHIHVNVPNLGLKWMMRGGRRSRSAGNNAAAGGSEDDNYEEESNDYSQEDNVEKKVLEGAADLIVGTEEQEEQEAIDDDDDDDLLLKAADEIDQELVLAGVHGIIEESEKPAALASSKKPAKAPDVPARKIYVDFDRLCAFHINIHPLDLLSSTHMQSRKGSDLRLDEFIFFRKDATIRRSSGGRRVLPVDLMINRLVEQLALKLLAANTLSIAGMMGGSTANNISSTVKSIFKR